MRFFILAVLFLCSFTVHAQDAGLYEPLASPDSAFIRLINTSTESSSLKIHGKRFPGPVMEQATAYYPIKSGTTDIEVGSNTIEKNTKSGIFYTIVETQSGLVIIEDKVARKEKAMISLYNFIKQKNLILKTTDGKIDIAGPVAFGETASKEINAVKIAMSVYDGDSKLSGIEEKVLLRGVAYTVLAFEDENGQIKTSIIDATIDTNN